MASATRLISMEEYLGTSYHPDREFVDGVVESRRPGEDSIGHDFEEHVMGEYEHNRTQTFLAAWFFSKEREWNVRVVTEQRTKVSHERVRVPDVSLIDRDTPREQVTITPPLLCIEILSPQDRLARAAKVMEDYRAMGVANLWLIDPIDRVAWTYPAEGLLKLTTDRLMISDSPIYVDLITLFAALD